MPLRMVQLTRFRCYDLNPRIPNFDFHRQINGSHLCLLTVCTFLAVGSGCPMPDLTVHAHALSGRASSLRTAPKQATRVSHPVLFARRRVIRIEFLERITRDDRGERNEMLQLQYQQQQQQMGFSLVRFLLQPFVFSTTETNKRRFMTNLSKFWQAPFFTEDYGNAIQFSRFGSLSVFKRANRYERVKFLYKKILRKLF